MELDKSMWGAECAEKIVYKKQQDGVLLLQGVAIRKLNFPNHGGDDAPTDE